MEVEIKTSTAICPRPKLEITALNVEGKVQDINGACAAKYDGREPEYVAIRLHDSHSIPMFLETLVGTAEYICTDIYIQYRFTDIYTVFAASDMLL